MCGISEGNSFNQKLVLACHRKSHQPQKESDRLIFHRKIEQTIEKAAAKVVHEKLHLRSYIQGTFNMKKLSDYISLREEFRIFLSQRIKYTSQEICKYLCTHPNYYVLMKLENIMRVERLNLNFSIKDDVKNVSKT